MSAAPSPTASAPVRRHRLAARFRLGSRLGSFHFSTVELLITLVLLLMASPFLEELERGELIEAILITMLLVGSVLAVGGGRKTVVRMSLLAVPAFLFKWLTQWRPDLVSPGWFLAAALFYCALVVWHLLRFALHSPRVNNEVLCASIAAYLLIGLVFAFAYMLVAQVIPRAFVFTTPGVTQPILNSHSALYFSFITMSTIGYGDIVPLAPVARTLAMTEAITGTLYVAVLIARLVALQTTHPAGGPAHDEDRNETTESAPE